MAKVKALCRRMCRRTGTSLPLDTLLIGLNQMLRGWCEYFRPGVSSATFQHVSSYVWKRVMKWLKRKHRRTSWKELRRRYCDGRWWPASNERELFDPAKGGTARYRDRGTAIPSPWPVTG
jgi:RNA-directed DNA polymerase